MVTTPNQGPATRPFTPPASCLSTTTYTTRYNDTPAGFTLGTDLDCFPSGTSALVSPTTSFVKLYSPGVCPVGYTYAAPYTESISGQNFDDSVTRYICCPDSYTSSHLNDGNHEICVVSTGFVPYVTATTSSGVLTALTTFAFGDSGDYVTASPIIVAWQSKDQQVLAALGAAGVSVDWPPANEQERIHMWRIKVILLSTLIPVGVILLTVTAWLLWLRKHGRLHWPSLWGRGSEPVESTAQHTAAFDNVLQKPELPGESHHRAQPAELAPDAFLTREIDSRGMEVPIAEADANQERSVQGPTAELTARIVQ